MPINFHDEQNRQTYATRNADESWKALIENTVDVTNKRIADIGCGGGIYTKALIEMGASHVMGVDFSDEMLKGAANNCKGIPNVTFLRGDAYESNLHANDFDIVLERALIHHLNDLNACFTEAYRILKKDGTFLIQDRTPKDCLLSGDKNHIRGYFFEKFPQLIDKEISRRFGSEQVEQALESSGFRLAKTVALCETRRVYHDFEELNKDLSLRTGRAILHELTDVELRELISFIGDKLDDHQVPIIEKDSWTVWFAIKE
ncbi:class I SAM-dependent methyltransferase [Paenibacillus lentus]|uniref:class I SAM-dependent methyltransferase n=1 Tax=Paenibacillus lentus TaxID=1338368 RepID=UPI003651FB76